MNNELLNDLFPSVLSSEGKEEFLKSVPHRNIPGTDLVMTAAVSLDAGMVGTITNATLGQLAMTQKEVLDAAIRHQQERPYVLQSISEMIGMEIMPGVPEVLVLTNENQQMGAGELLNKEALSAASERLGGDMYILPSSRHEVLLVPADTAEAEDLQRMVYQINRSVVSKEDRLSDHVYHYSAFDMRITDTIAKTMETAMDAESLSHSAGRRMA